LSSLSLSPSLSPSLSIPSFFPSLSLSLSDRFYLLGRGSRANQGRQLSLPDLLARHGVLLAPLGHLLQTHRPCLRELGPHESHYHPYRREQRWRSRRSRR